MNGKKQTKIIYRLPAGKADIVIFIIIAILITIGLAFFILKILEHSEEHVEKVKKTKIDYQESLTWRPDRSLCEKRIFKDLQHKPNQTNARYDQLTLTEKALTYIGEMSKLKTLNLGQTKLEDDWLQHISNLDLNVLKLSGASITDKSIKYILRFKHLNRLHIGDCDITDIGLEELSSNESIKKLFLELNKNITDKGINHLSKMTQLKHLELSYTGITASCINDLLKLSNLEILEMKEVKLAPSDIAKLKQLKNLKNLNFEFCGLNDKSLGELSKLKNLQSLNISNNSFTDKGLNSLERLKNLKFLSIQECPQITKAGINKFQKARPDCQVRFSKDAILNGRYSIDNLHEDVEFIGKEAIDVLKKQNEKKSTRYHR